jgi:hypothetical protein
MMDGEQYSIAPCQRHDFYLRLHSRTLLGEHEFASGEILPRIREEDSRLYRKYEFTIEILVQAVVVAGAVLE